jgi:hypothetical protein
MPSIRGKYWGFYIEGRDTRLLKHQIDEEVIVKDMVGSGKPLRDIVLATCTSVAAPLSAGRVRQKWITSHGKEIAEAGGDEDAAYSAFMQGQIDELAYAIEPIIVGELRGDDEEEDDDDDDEDEDDESEDEEDDDED